MDSPSPQPTASQVVLLMQCISNPDRLRMGDAFAPLGRKPPEFHIPLTPDQIGDVLWTFVRLIDQPGAPVLQTKQLRALMGVIQERMVLAENRAAERKELEPVLIALKALPRNTPLQEAMRRPLQEAVLFYNAGRHLLDPDTIITAYDSPDAVAVALAAAMTRVLETGRLQGDEPRQEERFATLLRHVMQAGWTKPHFGQLELLMALRGENDVDVGGSRRVMHMLTKGSDPLAAMNAYQPPIIRLIEERGVGNSRSEEPPNPPQFLLDLTVRPEEIGRGLAVPRGGSLLASIYGHTAALGVAVEYLEAQQSGRGSGSADIPPVALGQDSSVAAVADAMHGAPLALIGVALHVLRVGNADTDASSPKVALLSRGVEAAILCHDQALKATTKGELAQAMRATLTILRSAWDAGALNSGLFVPAIQTLAKAVEVRDPAYNVVPSYKIFRDIDDPARDDRITEYCLEVTIVHCRNQPQELARVPLAFLPAVIRQIGEYVTLGRLHADEIKSMFNGLVADMFFTDAESSERVIPWSIAPDLTVPGEGSPKSMSEVLLSACNAIAEAIVHNESILLGLYRDAFRRQTSSIGDIPVVDDPPTDTESAPNQPTVGPPPVDSGSPLERRLAVWAARRDHAQREKTYLTTMAVELRIWVQQRAAIAAEFQRLAGEGTFPGDCRRAAKAVLQGASLDAHSWADVQLGLLLLLPTGLVINDAAQVQQPDPDQVAQIASALDDTLDRLYRGHPDALVTADAFRRNLDLAIVLTDCGFLAKENEAIIEPLRQELEKMVSAIVLPPDSSGGLFK